MNLRGGICTAFFFVVIGMWSREEASPVRSAQTQQQQPSSTQTRAQIPVIKAEARLVLVDAIVADKKGNHITDLTQKDFRVWEDGTEQPIKTFSLESTASTTANQPSYLVLFFDDSNMKGTDQIRARQAAAKFIETNTGPNRYIAVLEFGGIVIVAQNFTADAERLKQVVRNEKYSSVSANLEPAQLAGLGSPPLMISTQADFAARTLLLGIRSVAKNMAAMPGRKSLVLLTTGFPLTPQLDSELIAAIDACNKANVAVYPIDVRGLTTEVGGGGMGSVDLTNALSTARLVTARAHYPAPQGINPLAHLVYVRDQQSGNSAGTNADSRPPGAGPPRGSGTGGWTGGGPSTYGPATPSYQSHRIVPVIPRSTASSWQALYSLAAGTGGFVILNSNDLVGALEKIAREQGEYYVLGYTPPPSQEETCHTLRVTVQRSGAMVRSRSGYCNVKRADLLAGKPIEKQLEAYAEDASSGNIPVSLRAPYFYASPNRARVEVAIEIPPGAVNITKQKGKFRGTIDVLGLAYKLDGTVGARFSDSMPLEFGGKKEVEEFSKTPLNYNHQFEAAPDHYDLKVVLASGGEPFAKLEMPLLIEPYDGKQIAMSAVALSKEFYSVSRTADIQAAGLLEDRVPLVSRGVEFVLSGSDHFKKGEPAAFYVEIYDPLLLGPNPPGVDVEVKVIDRKTGVAKVDARGAAPQVNTGNPMVPLGLKIPLETLPPGAYRLELKATDSTGNATRARGADFEVE